ncbi:MAG TPA: serine/threonine-protein kinase [Polyangiaceae bacterium]|nr:serine/threonine-protein kinase [Polyangiaceae bacterium]
MKTGRESVSEKSLASGQPAPGDWIGKKYRLKELRGAGGMGTVWVAHNAVLDIDVALKLMRFEQFRADPKRIFRRLLQEARAAARLEHPAIVRVFDFGLTDAGSPYIVMELLRGESLAELLARQPAMQATQAVQLLLPIADALATAHGRGIIHRDIKPENLFLATDEYGRLQPKIVDFGVARFLEGGRTMTRSGALMGTPDYMAPEQARGEADIDTRVDIWALCVVLYELIAGFRPFGGADANYLAVLRAIVHDEPNPQIREVAGDALWLILERGLRKKTHERWDTMRVLGEALALWAYERGVREDILGASIKATWLQSGLGGVKIETASMSPPAGIAAVAAADFRPGESGSLPVLGSNPLMAPDMVARPFVNVSLSGLRAFRPQNSVDLPSPSGASGGKLGSASISDAIEEILMLPPVGPPDGTKDADPSRPISVAFAESERPTAPQHVTRDGTLTPDPNSSPLVAQTQELRRLVLASIGVTALLALAVVVLLWDQRRIQTSSTPVTPQVAAPRANRGALKPPSSKPAASAAAPAPASANHTAPAPALSPSASTSASPSPSPSASAGTATPDAPSATPTPTRSKPRTAPRKKKTKYELGF